MSKKFNLIIFISFLSLTVYSQEIQDSINIKKKLNEVIVNSLRVNETTPVTYTEMNSTEIEKKNLGQDLPYIISLTPSLTINSDAGAGIGYTSLRLRGTDQTGINVTINGIPLNDSESHGVWWVNMPDLSSSIENLQIQRGVGTSKNGAASFGGSINLNTGNTNSKAYLTINSSIGSFATLKNNIEFGTGLINNKLSIDGRLSKIDSEGYIDRASSNLKSIFLQANYIKDKTKLKAVVLSGHERTYQAWYGVPGRYLDSNRTFNPYNYPNEVDNYNQSHFQLHFNRKLKESSFLDLAVHYTKGAGYYEQYIGLTHNPIIYNGEYQYGENNLSFYGLEDTITNIVRRKWLDNDFYGMTFSINHKINKTTLILGGASNSYLGKHFGKVIWSELNSDLDHKYYNNDAEKNDQNIFLKTDYLINNNTNIYADLQFRSINYAFNGKENQGQNTKQEEKLNFFNPKIGLFHKLNNNQSIYGSFAIANREPNRDDYVESTKNSRPKHETLNDIEIGYKFQNKFMYFNANIYNMIYINQLVLTGKINDVGAKTRINIDNSFRRGVELEGSIKLNSRLKWYANLTLSENKILEFTEYIDNWEGEQEKVKYKNTDIAFSPSTIWSSQFEINLYKEINISFISKYVGKQYLDNTSSNNRMLEDYLINHLRVNYDFNSDSRWHGVNISLQVNNVLNNKYITNAWVYRFISDNWDPRVSDPYINKDGERGYNMIGYFPQATRNYLLAISASF